MLIFCAEVKEGVILGKEFFDCANTPVQSVMNEPAVTTSTPTQGSRTVRRRLFEQDLNDMSALE